MGIDDLFEKFDEFEFEGATKLTPREYGKLRGIAPQLIYYYIRNGRIDVERCVCGRKVVDVEQTDKFFSSRQKAPGEGIHPDEPV